MRKESIPNMITGVRFLLIIPVAISLLLREYKIAFYVFILAGFSDGLDGFIARKFQWTSKFGTIADPIADKSLMMVTYLVFCYQSIIPFWLFFIIVFRDVWIIGGGIAYSHYIAKPEFKASWLSKINTVAQIGLVVFILFSLGLMPLPPVWINVLIGLVTLTTVASFLDYTWVWGKRAALLHKEVAKR